MTIGRAGVVAVGTGGGKNSPKSMLSLAMAGSDTREGIVIRTRILDDNRLPPGVTGPDEGYLAGRRRGRVNFVESMLTICRQPARLRETDKR